VSKLVFVCSFKNGKNKTQILQFLGLLHQIQYSLCHFKGYIIRYWFMVKHKLITVLISLGPKSRIFRMVNG
jgi:hypothetical protein